MEYGGSCGDFYYLRIANTMRSYYSLNIEIIKDVNIFFEFGKFKKSNLIMIEDRVINKFVWVSSYLRTKMMNSFHAHVTCIVYFLASLSLIYYFFFTPINLIN